MDTLNNLYLKLILLIIFSCSNAVLTLEPNFMESAQNVTEYVGGEAMLNCVIYQLGSYKMAWVKELDPPLILAVNTDVLIEDHRIYVSQGSDGSSIDWSLHIRNIQETDEGFYTCRINYSPMKVQRIYLKVFRNNDFQTPVRTQHELWSEATITDLPNFLDSSSKDTVVKENDNVLLTCHAKGHPQPNIVWRREDDEPMKFGNVGAGVKIVHGDTLNITRVSRFDMANYLCIASNEVQPSISRKIALQVNFGPCIKITHRTVISPVNSAVVLECLVEAFPPPVVYWRIHNVDMINSDDKYYMYNQKSVGLYKMQMQLKISELEREDFGEYICVARSKYGHAEGVIQLSEFNRETLEPDDEPWAPDNGAVGTRLNFIVILWAILHFVLVHP